MLLKHSAHVVPVLAVAILIAVTVVLTGCQKATDEVIQVEILNVSYDPTREFYSEFNEAFAAYYLREKGIQVNVSMSHGGSSQQARSVAGGLHADVVTLALAYDIDSISGDERLVNPGWQEQFAYNSSPYTSTIVFLVRRGNPKNISTWEDLVRPDVTVITPNPKTSGGARWNYLAAWGYMMQKELGDLNKIKDPQFAEEVEAARSKTVEYMRVLFENVPILDSGARGSTLTFAQRRTGDVLLAWENEAIMAIQEFGSDQFEIVNPPISILAEPPIAVVDRVADQRGTREVAEDYLKFLYSSMGQEIAARHHFRPRDREIARNYARRFPAVNLFTLGDVFGSWREAQETHFVDGGIFDQIYRP